MTFTVAGDYGGRASASLTAGAAPALTFTAVLDITANSGFAVVVVGMDNVTAGGAEIVSSNIVLACSGGGVTFTKVGEHTGGATTAAFATVASFYVRPTTTIPSGTLITISLTGLGGATYQACITSIKGNITDNYDISATGQIGQSVSGGVSAGGITIAALTSREYLFVHGCGNEESVSAAWTEDANYTAMTERDVISRTAAAAGMGVRGAYRVLTGTGDIYDPNTGLGDRARLFYALYEVPVTVAHTLTAGLDAELLKSLTLTGVLDALLQKQMSTTAGADAILQKAISAVTGLDATLLKELSKTTGLDATLLKQLSSTTGLDATLLKIITAAASIDSLIVSSGTAITASIDAALLKQMSTTALLDVLLLKTMQATTTLDAVFPAVQTLLTFIDAQLSKSIAVRLTMDAIMTGSWRRQAATTAYWTATIPVDG